MISQHRALIARCPACGRRGVEVAVDVELETGGDFWQPPAGGVCGLVCEACGEEVNDPDSRREAADYLRRWKG